MKGRLVFQYPQWVVGGCNRLPVMWEVPKELFQYPQWVVGGCN